MRDSRRRLIWAVAAFVLYNLFLTVIAVIAKLPDIPHTHAKTDQIGVATVLWGSGSIISPPFVFMAVTLVCTALVCVKNIWVARAGAILLLATTLLMVVDEVLGDGGLGNKPALYSQAKWDFALVLGWIFTLLGVLVVVFSLVWLAHSRRSTADGGPEIRPTAARSG